MKRGKKEFRLICFLLVTLFSIILLSTLSSAIVNYRKLPYVGIINDNSIVMRYESSNRTIYSMTYGICPTMT